MPYSIFKYEIQNILIKIDDYLVPKSSGIHQQ